jgi:hypothetical protein
MKKRIATPRHKQIAPVSIITVKSANGTYTAAWDGEKTSCTAGPELAAQRLARKILGSEINLKRIPDERYGYYRYQVCIASSNAEK